MIIVPPFCASGEPITPLLTQPSHRSSPSVISGRRPFLIDAAAIAIISHNIDPHLTFPTPRPERNWRIMGGAGALWDDWWSVGRTRILWAGLKSVDGVCGLCAVWDSVDGPGGLWVELGSVG